MIKLLVTLDCSSKQISKQDKSLNGYVGYAYNPFKHPTSKRKPLGSSGLHSVVFTNFHHLFTVPTNP